MKYSFPILTAVLGLVAVLIYSGDKRVLPLLAVLQGRGGDGVTLLTDPISTGSESSGSKSTSPETNWRAPEINAAGSPVGSGNAVEMESSNRDSVRSNINVAQVPGHPLMIDAAQRLFRLPSLEARLHQGIEMFGHKVDAQGTYLQQGTGDVKLLHLELRMNAADQITIVQQVCDGRFLWSWRDSPFEKKRTRIDLKEVRRAFESHPEVINNNVALTNLWMTLGGLPKLLQGLHNNYDFGMAVPEVIYQSHVADVRGMRQREQVASPVWIVPGQMKKELLASFLPQQREAILAGQPPNVAALPPQWPDRVTVWLGRDNVVPLFPYRIEFQRSQPTKTNKIANSVTPSEETVPAKPTTLMWLQLSEVAVGADIDPQQFRYPAGTREVPDDDTQRFLKSLGIAP